MFVCCNAAGAAADLSISSQQLEAYNYYKKNTMSIEILKDDHLQKVNFRVKNKVSSIYMYIIHSCSIKQTHAKSCVFALISVKLHLPFHH